MSQTITIKMTVAEASALWTAASNSLNYEGDAADIIPNDKTRAAAYRGWHKLRDAIAYRPRRIKATTQKED